jgi:hypothetical protein
MIVSLHFDQFHLACTFSSRVVLQLVRRADVQTYCCCWRWRAGGEREKNTHKEEVERVFFIGEGE